MYRVILIALFILSLLPYPYTISLSTSEASIGDTVIATISVPEGTDFTLHTSGLVASTPVYIGGDTWKVSINIPETIIRGQIYPTSLVVNGEVKSVAHVRVKGYALYLPIMRK